MVSFLGLAVTSMMSAGVEVEAPSGDGLANHVEVRENSPILVNIAASDTEFDKLVESLTSHPSYERTARQALRTWMEKMESDPKWMQVQAVPPSFLQERT